MTRTIWTNFHSPILRSLNKKFEFNWPSGFREDVWKCWRTDAGVTGILLAHPWALGFFKKFFQDHYQNVKRFGSRSGRTYCWSWSGSKLFNITFFQDFVSGTLLVSNNLDPDQDCYGSKLYDKVISRQQNLPLVGKLRQQQNSKMSAATHKILAMLQEKIKAPTKMDLKNDVCWSPLLQIIA